VEHLSGAPLKYAPAPITNIRLGWKGLPGTNTFVKRFIYKKLCPRANVIKQYAAVILTLLFWRLKYQGKLLQK
jgi:hypothetical protein